MSLRDLDYSVLQQCMHCGLCLPSCPTFRETGRERNSPRGRIALMRAVADRELDLDQAFAEEMSYCLGCLACTTACPAGVDYGHLLEHARADCERAGLLDRPARRLWRWLTMRVLFRHPRLLRLAGRLLWAVQASGLQTLARRLGLTRLLPADLRAQEPNTPPMARRFSHQLIRPIERPTPGTPVRARVALLTGCVQDLIYSQVNRDTVDVLLANGCEVHTPAVQPCCGSLHAHNGDLETSRELARRQLDLFDPAAFDAIITNAGGCGAHLRHYGRLLAADPRYAARAAAWDAKLRDIHEFLTTLGPRPPQGAAEPTRVTYHESCHLCHGQQVSAQPRALLRLVPGLQFTELPEANWCCGSAGVYSLTQPAQANKLQARKCGHIAGSGAQVVTAANPGCQLFIENGLRQTGSPVRVEHPISLLAAAYRREKT